MITLVITGVVNSVTQVIVVLDMVAACWLCGGKAQRRNNCLCQHICPGESCPLALTLSDTSVPSHVPLATFKLHPQHWSSEGVSVSQSKCRHFKRNCLGLQKFLSSTASIPDFFTDKSNGDFSSWHCNSELGGLVGV